MVDLPIILNNLQINFLLAAFLIILILRNLLQQSLTPFRKPERPSFDVLNIPPVPWKFLKIVQKHLYVLNQLITFSFHLVDCFEVRLIYIWQPFWNLLGQLRYQRGQLLDPLFVFNQDVFVSQHLLKPKGVGVLGNALGLHIGQVGGSHFENVVLVLHIFLKF